MHNISTKLRTLLIATTLCCTQANASTNGEYTGLKPPKRNIIEDGRLSSQECLAMNLYRESRSESDNSNLMILGIIMNRKDDDRFPNDYCEIVFQHKQFSWVSDFIYKKVKNILQYQRLFKLAEQALMNPEMVKLMAQGATHYHEKSIKPYWVNKDMKFIARVDNHLFYRWEKK